VAEDGVEAFQLSRGEQVCAGPQQPANAVERVAGPAAMPEGVLLDALPAALEGSASAVAVLKPVNPSIATTRRPARKAAVCASSQARNTALLRPSTRSSSRAGPVPLRTGVRSMITVTKRSTWALP